MYVVGALRFLVIGSLEPAAYTPVKSVVVEPTDMPIIWADVPCRSGLRVLQGVWADKSISLPPFYGGGPYSLYSPLMCLRFFASNILPDPSLPAHALQRPLIPSTKFSLLLVSIRARLDCIRLWYRGVTHTNDTDWALLRMFWATCNRLRSPTIETSVTRF
jgi:hypothetical protein